jgi:glycosyltransferase involved in cell wall biosynthesis
MSKANSSNSGSRFVSEKKFEVSLNLSSNNLLTTSRIATNSAMKPVIKPFPPHSGRPARQAIALISEHGDPAAVIGKEEAGGQNVYVRQVGETLAKLGWQVDMFTRKVDPNAPSIVQHSPHCRTIRLKAGPETFIPRDQLFSYMPEFVESLCQFQTKAGTHYPLVHTNYWMSAWVGLQLKQRSNVQLVHTYHSLGAVKYQSIADRPAIAATRLAVERQILEQGDCVVATSPQEQADLRALVSKQGLIEVIPCGTDMQTFHVRSKSEARAQLGFKPDQKIVLYVGRFDPRKGIETLVRAMAKLQQSAEVSHPDLRLVIVGGSDPSKSDGQEQARISFLVEELGLAQTTEFVGQVGHDRLPDYYTAADVCVIPSHYEPFGLVALEAMACGTPVVASDVGGLKFTVVPGQTGWLVPPQDVDGFAAAIERVVNQQWLLGQRQKLATRVQENFSWNGVAAQLSDLYRRLLVQSLTHPGVIYGWQRTLPLSAVGALPRAV